MIFSYFKHYFIFFNVNKHLAVSFFEWEGLGPLWTLSVSFVYTKWLVWAYFYSPTSLILLLEIFHVIFILLSSVCMVDQTQIYPSSISLLELFQGIVYNIHSVTLLPPLVIGVLGFLKNHSWGGSRCSCKDRG